MVARALVTPDMATLPSSSSENLRFSIASPGNALPFPVIVGVPRSGTTMLRLMLDSHLQLAIPPETGFLTGLNIPDDSRDVRTIADRITGFPTSAPAWPDFGIGKEEFFAAVNLLPAGAGLAEVLRLFYTLYAARHGKARGGDKTPLYMSHMRTIAAVLPEAYFIHIIRDGRDVALSWSKTWFAPSRDLPDLVGRWASLIRDARAQAEGLRYMEVRYEHLVRAPERTLRDICGVIGLDFDARMLAFHERSAHRLTEHRDRMTADGKLLVSREERLHQQRRTKLPPQEDRIAVWRRDMTADEVAVCEQTADGLLGPIPDL